MLTPGDQLRQLGALGGPLGAAHDPDEEVGGEEGPEDHHLGDDEKQHAEQLRLDARGAVGLRRAVAVLVVDAGVAAVRDRCGFHQASAPAGSLDSTCSTGLPPSRCELLDEALLDPLRAVRGQGGDDDLGDVEVLQGVERGGVGVGVADHAGGDDVLRVERLQQLPQPLAGRAHRAPVARVLRDDDDEAARALLGELLEALDELAAGHGLVGEHERDVERQALASRRRPRCAGRAGPSRPRGAPAGRGAASPRSTAGSVEMMISSIPWAPIASVAALNGSASPTSPVPSMPSSRMNASARSTRTCAESRTASS